MPGASEETTAHQIAEATARSSYSKLVAYLAVQTRDVAAAEDALADAFAKALSDWPRNGCPDHPEAWLLTVARRRAIDGARRQQRGNEINQQLQLLADLDDAEDLDIPDRRLGLLFACTHPAIDRSIRAPLMLQVILGLKAETIASAFLIAPSTMGQRLVRAKNKLRQAGVPFHVPERKNLPERVDTVLDAIYATYTEGWTDPVGTDVARRELANEAIFLCTLITELLPEEPEALGLLSLMLHTEARRSARRDDKNQFVPLAQQDSESWNTRMIEHAESLLRRAGAIGRMGRFQIEAALQSAHVHRRRTDESNWPAVLELYNALFDLTRSPVVAVNRALALAEVDGPSPALEALDEIADLPRMTEYQPYWAVRAELLTRNGAVKEAQKAYEIAIGLERDSAVRQFLRERQLALRK